ncbi:hypothetical protein [Lentzea flaviverrucosa]|uniref:Uncharacterized protein n=1 Tax=Lentzea flaviverrucosa TaxID=200379 RepID=A0A1H9GWG3_9PSEU|nr:hypothetical protein [Lentzea flaviverrucosa]RDI34777.1 hypothetical protein DFR72_101526 [Lentzea flaviverrucosa]SEQ54431.1 hypothetical protein SAMN05216195_102691 [Lentzea flaviverrucosa]
MSAAVVEALAGDLVGLPGRLDVEEAHLAGLSLEDTTVLRVDIGNPGRIDRLAVPVRLDAGDPLRPAHPAASRSTHCCPRDSS